VTGIVVSKLNVFKIASVTGDVPQNVNFAIKASLARTFLEENNMTPQISSNEDPVKTQKIAFMADESIFVAICQR